MSLVALTILGLIPLLRLLNAKIVLELSIQLLPHVPLVLLRHYSTPQLMFATASESSVLTIRRAPHAEITNTLSIMFARTA